MSLIRMWKRNSLNREMIVYIALYALCWVLPAIYGALLVLHWFGLSRLPGSDMPMLAMLILIWLEIRVPHFMEKNKL